MRAFYHEWKPGGRLEDQKSPGTEINHFTAARPNTFPKSFGTSVDTVLRELLAQTMRLKTVHIHFSSDIFHTAAWEEIRNEPCLEDVL